MGRSRFELVINAFLICSALVFAAIGAFFLIKGGTAPAVNSKILTAAICGGIALFLLLSLTRSANFRLNTAATVGTVVFSIFLLEAMIPFVDAIKARQAVAARDQVTSRQNSLVGGNYDRRTKTRVVLDLRKNQKNVYPSVHPGVFFLRGIPEIYTKDGKDTWPLGGISNVTSVFCNEGGQYSIYESDEHGFRNPKGLYQKGNVTIAALGDSIVHGSCVPEGTDILGWIRREVPRSLNFGMYGSGPITELATFREYVEPMQPKVVLWFFLDSDMGDITVEKNADFLTKYFDPAYRRNIIERQADLDAKMREFVEAELKERAGEKADVDVEGQMAAEDPNQKFHIPLKTRIRDILALRRLRERAGLVFHPDLEILKRTISTANNAAASWNGKIYFVYVPDQEQVAHPERRSPFKESVMSVVHGLGVPVIDVDLALKKHPDPLSLFPFRGRRHFNEEGYKMVADTVLARLRQDQLIPAAK